MPDEVKRPLKVFLCHASADKPKVRELYRYLKRRGLQPWLDAEDLLPGQAWQVEIPKAIETSDAIIICLSKGSVNQEGYVQKEIKYAVDKALEMPEGRIFLIPARLEECEVPYGLKKYQWVDLFDESGFSKLMRSLKERASQLERATVQVSKQAENSSYLAEKPKQELHDGISVNVNGNVQGNIIIGNENAVQSQTALSVESSDKKTAQLQWAPTDALQDGKPYISIDITSKENCLIKCYCYIKSVELNGVLRDDIKRDIAKHTTRVSWWGGSDEDVGIKYIDPMGFGRLNLASLDDKISVKYPLQFETAKGPQYKGHDGKFFLQFGDYTIVLGLSCIADGVEFIEIPITISFKYAEEHQPGGDNHIKWTETHQILRLLPKDKSLSPQIENLDKLEKLGSPSPVKKKAPEKPPRKLKTEYIIAIITTAATLLAALIGILPQYLNLVPAPTAIFTVTTTATTFFTQVPMATLTITTTRTPFTPSLTATFTDLPPSETPEPRLTPTEALTLTPTSLPTETTNAKDMEMLLAQEVNFKLEGSSPPIHLHQFYIDKFEVTNAHYKDCVDAGGCLSPQKTSSSTRPSYYGNAKFDDYPVVYVNWNMARTYCEWRGARLPTEVEWEYAALGVDGRTYPWGETIDETFANYSNRIGDTTLVGKYPGGQSVFGLFDMAGNVWEWVSSLNKPYPYNREDGRENPTAPGDRGMRGGAWNSAFSNVKPTYRFYGKPGYANYDIGFRCARDAKP